MNNTFKILYKYLNDYLYINDFKKIEYLEIKIYENNL
jgi:hypothetical protein